MRIDDPGSVMVSWSVVYGIDEVRRLRGAKVES